MWTLVHCYEIFLNRENTKKTKHPIFCVRKCSSEINIVTVVIDSEKSEQDEIVCYLMRES